MLKRLSAFAAALIVSATIVPSPAHAKPRPKAYTIAVPFDFVVGNRTMPAGNYRFQLVFGSPTQNDTGAVLAVRSEDGRYYASTFTSVTEGDAPSDGPRLVFSRAGDHASLSQLWEQGNSNGLKLNVPNADTQLAQGREEILILSR
jgi:hypothetical protein